MASSANLEWRINVPTGTTEILTPETSFLHRISMQMKCFFLRLFLKTWKFLEKAWKIASSEPKKVVHGLKVGLALSLVSLLYYMRPLYDGVGGTAMWAIMTVVVTFESTVGATFYKCINRVMGTSLAGCLGIGIHWVAAQTGHRFEPIILSIALFLLASATTFSRFIPSVKSRFDYGATIFILTFCLVTISGYRVDRIFELTHERLTTIAIGTALCIIVSMLVWPIWAGSELQNLIARNLDKLSYSFEGCVSEYFKENGVLGKDEEEDCGPKVQGYKCVLNSKGSEDSMANFARWEPAHGRIGFRHPWKHYLKVGASLRRCASCIEALHACLNSDIQAPDSLKNNLAGFCTAVSSSSSKVLKELSTVIKSMTKSTHIHFAVSDMNFAVQQLQDAVKSLPISEPQQEDVEGGQETMIPPLMELLPLATLVSLLIETASRVEDVVNAADELADAAGFDSPEDEKKPSSSDVGRRISPEV